MKKILMVMTVLGIVVSPLAADENAFPGGSPSLEAHTPRSFALDRLEAVSLAAGLEPGAPVKGGPTCTIADIDCNSTMTSSLRATDCALDNGTFADFYVFDGVTGDTVTINAMSSAFDTVLFLLDPTPDVVAIDDDGGSGTNSRIVFTLGASGQWAIAVNNLFPASGDPGNYTLSLACAGAGPSPPAAPSNLTAMTISSTEIDIFWQDNSNNEDDFQIQARVGGGNFQTLGTVSANSIGASISNLDPDTNYGFRVRARNSAGNSGWSNTANARTDTGGGPPPPPPPPPPTGECFPDATTMCLNGGRFRVEVDFRDFNGVPGDASVVPFGSDDSGLYFFFSPDNWEMLVKVLDGCSINNRFWVFAAATTNVEYTLRVTDTETNVSKQYFNPLGRAAPAITDTDAFATCP